MYFSINGKWIYASTTVIYVFKFFFKHKKRIENVANKLCHL